LLDEPLVGKPPSDPVWRSVWYANEHRAGVPPRATREARTVDEWLDAIASGAGIGFAPESAPAGFRNTCGALTAGSPE
jgi:DNA-binding transcriptional LysR family regulator